MLLIHGDDLKNFSDLGNFILRDAGLSPEQFLLLDELYQERLGGKNRWRNPVKYTNKKMKRLLTGTDDWMFAEIQLLAEILDVEEAELLQRFKKFIYSAEEHIGEMVPEAATTND